MIKGAVISEDGLYRYSLVRIWATALPTVCFIGLNPSTADATNDDNTIKKCVKFAQFWGCGSLVMVNLFAYRATLPPDMKKYSAPVGPENDLHLHRWAKEAKFVVAAWGNHGRHRGRDKEVMARFDNLLCFGFNDNGTPPHPLYQLDDAPLYKYPSGELLEPQPRCIEQPQLALTI